MRRALTLVVFVALIASIYSHNVVDLTASNFAEKVLNSDGIWMVAFVAPWCGHCQRLHPEYDKAADALGGVVNMARINCDDEKQLAQQYGIQGFPTIKVFNAGKENKKKPEDYQQQRQAKAIVDYLMYKFNSLSDPVKKLASTQDADSFTASSPDKMKAILFTSKATNPALFKSLAVELAKTRGIDFAYVPNSNEELKSRYGVDKEPSIVIIPSGGESTVKYDGAMKKDALMQYFLKFGAKPTASAESSKPDTTYKSKPKAPKQVKISQVATSSHLKTECDRMCVIGFTQTEEQIKFFNSLAQHHAADSDRVRFVTLAENVRESAANAFDVKPSGEDHTVTVVVLRGNKKKYASKDINDADADAFFDRVLFGEYPMKRIDELPTFDNVSTKDHDEL